MTHQLTPLQHHTARQRRINDSHNSSTILFEAHWIIWNVRIFSSLLFSLSLSHTNISLHTILLVYSSSLKLKLAALLTVHVLGEFLFQFVNKYVLCLIAFLRVKFATFIIHNSLRCLQCFSRLRLRFHRCYFRDDVAYSG